MIAMLALINGTVILYTLGEIVVAALLFYAGKWAIGEIDPAEPFKKILTIILILGVFFLVADALLRLIGHPIIAW